MSDNSTIPEGAGLIAGDPWLEPYEDALVNRFQRFQNRLHEIETGAGSLQTMAQGHEYFGFNRGTRDGVAGVWYREWAPGAKALFLIGDFNHWDRRQHPMKCDRYGVWEIFLPDAGPAAALTHGTRVKVHVVSDNGALDRIPAYIRRVAQNDETQDFSGVFWDPPPYKWRHARPAIRSLRIYEAHIGMAQEREGIGTFREFTGNILPRIKELGYTAVQLMGIQQHPYYASFGYHVSSFFAVSHFFGPPEDLKELIDTAHGLGLQVFLDIVHSHTVKNVMEGLNEFDGTHYHYFHAGGRGEHWAWDSKLFDYGKFEVLRFLLSNVRFWLEEFHFDGLRFDGVTSMLYLDHGLHRAFGHYDEYFDEHNLDHDALTYLQLANALVHTLDPDAVTIAEEMSGMPGLARPILEGGLGFDYRLAMGIPDEWIRLLKDVRDEYWPMEGMFRTLTNRRPNEPHVAYCESHDQAMVGDKTIAFRLMDSAMYDDMAIGHENYIIDRGIALHKMIRMVTYAFGGEAWLNFMGNEFGHPEWIDFPRDGNNYSYKFARRQWSLVDSRFLRYKFLKEFDKAMHRLEDTYRIFAQNEIELLTVHEDNKLICARRGELVFIFNFHPEKSLTDHRIGVPEATNYQIVLTSDMSKYGGFGRILDGHIFPADDEPWDEMEQSLQTYLPCRTAIVLAPVRRKSDDHDQFIPG